MFFKLMQYSCFVITCRYSTRSNFFWDNLWVIPMYRLLPGVDEGILGEWNEPKIPEYTRVITELRPVTNQILYLIVGSCAFDTHKFVLNDCSRFSLQKFPCRNQFWNYLCISYSISTYFFISGATSLVFICYSLIYVTIIVNTTHGRGNLSSD